MSAPSRFGCLSWTSMPCRPLSEQIALAAAPGLGQLEVHLPQVLAEGAQAVASALARHRVRAVAATGLMPGSLLHQDLDLPRLREGLAALDQIGCPVAVLTLDHTITAPYPQAEQETLKRLRALVGTAATYGVRLAVEALGTPGGHTPAQGSGPEAGIRTLLQVAELLDGLGRKSTRVGVCVDAVSWAATGAHIEHITGLGHPVRHVRVADAPCPRRLPVAQWRPAHRLMPGDGALDWTSFGTALAQADYSGPWALAVTNPGIRSLPGPELVARALAATQYLHSSTTTKPSATRAA
ncbi:sugar phosphate isomerase/epimerase [Nocardiopsis exhalans]|uniref:Sugar phosphate isomerase/epimerase n=1 Tax=Nocardiopsis exhalans TaxID=163604 RepID=A0ABY5D2Q7_9ACTN|nr:TIM barrel protein [Nocardiopsis exhalans]USY18051.1 sugar phosphate isomerase/epimerase [Nocardiopsis exhalans]